MPMVMMVMMVMMLLLSFFLFVTSRAHRIPLQLVFYAGIYYKRNIT